MLRAIVAVAAILGAAVFALHRARLLGNLEEPFILIAIGTFFVVLGRLMSGGGEPEADKREAPLPLLREIESRPH